MFYQFLGLTSRNEFQWGQLLLATRKIYKCCQCSLLLSCCQWALYVSGVRTLVPKVKPQMAKFKGPQNVNIICVDLPVDWDWRLIAIHHWTPINARMISSDIDVPIFGWSQDRGNWRPPRRAQTRVFSAWNSCAWGSGIQTTLNCYIFNFKFWSLCFKDVKNRDMIQ